ncbi:hypothetical protein ACFL3B_06245, partial [Gemmatimonadota bacterium]
LFGNMTAGHFVILSLLGLIFLFGHLTYWNWAIGFAATGLVIGIMMLERQPQGMISRESEPC